MSAHLINGRQIADDILDGLKRDIAALGFAPGLGVVLVGDDPASRLYVGLKKKAAARVGMKFEKTVLPATTTEAEVIVAVENFNRRADIHGIIVQLPLPAGLDDDRVIAAIDPRKDADGFHPENREAFLKNGPTIGPVLVGSVVRLITSTVAPLAGKTALVVANSGVFCLPMIHALEHLGLSAVWTAPEDPRLAEKTRAADVLIVCVGRAGLVTGGMVKQGAIVVDIGTNRLADGRVVGDVDRDSVQAVAGFLTPVPGGVGPMTVATLLKNTVELAKRT